MSSPFTSLGSGTMLTSPMVLVADIAPPAAPGSAAPAGATAQTAAQPAAIAIASRRLAGFVIAPGKIVPHGLVMGSPRFAERSGPSCRGQVGPAVAIDELRVRRHRFGGAADAEP